MKVLLALPYFSTGGVESHTEYLCRGFLNRGLKVVLVAKGGDRIPTLLKAGASFAAIDVKSNSPFTLPFRITALQRVINDTKVDLVHAHSRVPAFIGYYASRIAGIPFVTTAHSQYSPHLGSKVMGWGQQVIAVSPMVGHHLQAKLGVSPTKIKVIEEGIDLDYFAERRNFGQKIRADWQIPADYFVFGQVSRLTFLKGQDLLLKALALLQATNWREGKWTAILVGDGSRAKHLQKLTHRLNLTDKVKFCGEQTDIASYLSAMDMFILTSTREGWGLAAMEAMAAGLPVIMTKCGGISAAVNPDQEAVILEARSVEDLAATMIGLGEDEILRQKIAKAGQEFVRDRYNLDVMIDKTLAVYESLL